MMFRQDIEPRCAYCARGVPLNEHEVACKRKGVVDHLFHCRSFSYDPLKRIPPKPATLRTKGLDFALDDSANK